MTVQTLLKEMKADEAKAPKEYRRLLVLLPKKSDQAKIRKIIKDEQRHLKVLRTIRLSD